MNNKELELYELITMPDENQKDITYVSQFGWIDNTEFYIYVRYIYLEKFVNEFKRIFGDNVFECIKIKSDMKSDELKIRLDKALARCIDLNNIFLKEVY